MRVRFRVRFRFMVRVSVRATLPLQFLVLKSQSSQSQTIHTRDRKLWEALLGVTKILRTPVGCPSST